MTPGAVSGWFPYWIVFAWVHTGAEDICRSTSKGEELMLPDKLSVENRPVAKVVSTATSPRDIFLPLDFLQETSQACRSQAALGISGSPSGEPIGPLYRSLLL